MRTPRTLFSEWRSRDPRTSGAAIDVQFVTTFGKQTINRGRNSRGFIKPVENSDNLRVINVAIAFLQELVKPRRLLGGTGVNTKFLGKLVVAENRHSVFGGSSLQWSHEVPAMLRDVRAQGNIFVVVFTRHRDTAKSHLTVVHGSAEVGQRQVFTTPP